MIMAKWNGHTIGVKGECPNETDSRTFSFIVNDLRRPVRFG